MYQLKVSNKEEEKMIAETKSNSGIHGPDLMKDHISLGYALGKQMSFDKNDTTVVAILRGGTFFAQGIYMALGCKFAMYNPKLEEYKRPDTKNVILVDSVINSGKTIIPLIDENTAVACVVINDKAIEKMPENLYVVRVSANSYVGADVKVQKGNVGPDTTSRLFNQI